MPRHALEVGRVTIRFDVLDPLFVHIDLNNCIGNIELLSRLVVRIKDGSRNLYGQLGFAHI